MPAYHRDGRYEERMKGASVIAIDDAGNVVFRGTLGDGRILTQSFSLCGVDETPGLKVSTPSLIEKYHIEYKSTGLSIYIHAEANTATAVLPDDTVILKDVDFVKSIFGSNVSITDLIKHYNTTFNPSDNLQYDGRCGYRMEAPLDRFCAAKKPSTEHPKYTTRTCAFKLCKAAAGSTKENLNVHCQTVGAILYEDVDPVCDGPHCMMVQENRYNSITHYPLVNVFASFGEQQATLTSVRCLNPKNVTVVDCDTCFPSGNGYDFKCLAPPPKNADFSSKVERVSFILNYDKKNVTTSAEGHEEATCPQITPAPGDATTEVPSSCGGSMLLNMTINYQPPKLSHFNMNQISIQYPCQPGQLLHLVENERFTIRFFAVIGARVLIDSISVFAHRTNETIEVRGEKFDITSTNNGIFNTSSNGVFMEGGEHIDVSFILSNGLTVEQLKGTLSISSVIVEFPHTITVGDAVTTSPQHRRQMAAQSIPQPNNTQKIDFGDIAFSGHYIEPTPQPSTVDTKEKTQQGPNVADTNKSYEGKDHTTITIAVVVTVVVVVALVVGGVLGRTYMMSKNRIYATQDEPSEHC